MDSQARQQALNITESFIVQAPAGSGKTELLTQRVLALLAKAEQAEEIVALTFTRKAAQEMRHRILQALSDAAHKTPVKNQHQEKTRYLATQALERSQALNWNILQHPQSLQITTFDAFCLKIYQSLPNAHAAIIPNLATHPKPIYKKAIQNWFQYCRSQDCLQEDLKQLLMQARNQVEHMFKNMLDLLQSRDQWIWGIQNNKHQDGEQHQLALRLCLLPHWHNFQDSLEEHLQTECIELIHICLKYIQNNKFEVLKDWQDFESIRADQVKALSQFLLTEQQEFRKSFNQHIGLLKKFCPEDIYQDIQERSTMLLQELAENHVFKTSLLNLKSFPDPENIDLNFPLISAYYRLLPLLLAHLHLEFEQQHKTDYIYIAQYALHALESSDLNVYLDAKIKHLLVDEFQDTSWTQWQLLQKITQDFPYDPTKTVFIVGDPMQSIYRFRSADVGIFLEVQEHGLGQLALTPLYLQQNFRSNQNLIHHFNQAFSSIFPNKASPELGAVCFHPAHAVIPAQSDSFIQAHYYPSLDTQACAILEILAEAKNHPQLSIAILVKKRKQLKVILKYLKQESIPFQGVDLYPLSERMHIRDVWNLSQLLLYPGHRRSELAVLRGPYVGLSLEELHYLAELNPKQSLFSKPIDWQLLSDASQIRLQAFLNFLDQNRRYHLQRPIVESIEEFINHYHFHQFLNASEQEELLKFYSILDYFCEQSAWPKMEDIQDLLDQTYVSASDGFTLQIMTIHKSKGLEFDWVIIPDMGRNKNKMDATSLQTLNSNHSDSPLSQIYIPKEQDSAVFAFCQWQESQQQLFENQRLCYVAFTRAKQRLYLLDSEEKPAKSSFRALFSETFFSAGQDQIIQNSTERHTKIRQAPLNHYLLQLPNQNNIYPAQSFTPNDMAKKIGIISHRLLQWLCEFHPQSSADIAWTILERLIQDYRLPLRCFDQIQAYVLGFYHHPIGQWIMQAHAEEHNEYALLIQEHDIVREIILDRTFVDKGVRWIIDFKTSTETDEYKHQLNRYAKHLAILKPQQPIHCGLFYLAQLEWQTWTYHSELMLEA